MGRSKEGKAGANGLSNVCTQVKGDGGGAGRERKKENSGAGGKGGIGGRRLCTDGNVISLRCRGRTVKSA